MDLPRSLTLVNYAVNGRGLGHVTRLAAINRWLRRYATFAGVRTQHWFLTTSEADSFLFHEGFAAFKLPSKSIVEEAGIPKPAYLALAKQWIWSGMALLRPDLLLVDTFPNGSFDELLGVLDLCRRKALVMRPTRPELAERPSFRATAALYDRLIMTALDDVGDARAPGPDGRRDQVRRVGPIMLTERFEAADRAEARRRLGVPDDPATFCLLVSGGGGGDEGVARLLDATLAAVAADPSVHVVLAAGPLYRGAPRRGPRVVFWTEPRLAEALPGVDGAICAAGFNTAHELMYFGVPTALLAQDKIADDQAARAAALLSAGAVLEVASQEPAGLAAVVAALRDPTRAASLRQNAAALVPRNCARHAAAELLDLVLPTSVVRQAVDVIDDELLAEARGLGVELGDLVDCALALHGGRRIDHAALELGAARAVLRAAHAAEAPARLGVRLATALGRKLGPDGEPDDLGEAAALLLAHPLARGQASALVTLLERLGTERDASPERAAARIVALLDAGNSAGVDLYRIVDELSRAQADGELPNPVAIERTRARLQGGPAAARARA
jgi:predicted glycosyltransferase